MSRLSMNFLHLRVLLVAVVALGGAGLTGCAKKTDDGPGCTVPLTGSSWVPSITGAASSNHDSAVSVSKTVLSATGPIVGLQEAAPTSKEITVTIDMSQDLGDHGSLTLLARTTTFPGLIQGTAWPILVELSDSAGNKFVNMDRTGAANSCASKGYYTCSGTLCTPNTSCAPITTSGSAYINREQWEQHQVLNAGGVNFPSVNTFPTCNWADGTSATGLYPTCAFNAQSWFTGTSKLRTGTYTAKYVLLSNTYKDLSAYTFTGGLEVSVIKKTDTALTPTGAMDLNVIIVGTKNVNASRTAKGQQNLNTLFSTVGSYYSTGASPIKIGTVNAIEWPCESGGDAYDNVGTAGLGEMFAKSGTIVPAAFEGKALNIFLVSTIQNDISSLNPNAVIDGFSGAIGGPMLNGTAASGLAFATFDKLDTYNPSCTGTANCGLTLQESAFYNMETTIAHEMGHYLGLNHPSESAGTSHDQVPDTPVCTATQSVSGSSILTINTCLNTDANIFPATSKTCHTACTSYNSSTGVFCDTTVECQFNHIMWYTSKNFKQSTGTGDGNIFSTDSREVMGFNPFVQ